MHQKCKQSYMYISVLCSFCVHHSTHLSFGFIGEPSGHSNAVAKSSSFIRVPRTLLSKRERERERGGGGRRREEEEQVGEGKSKNNLCIIIHVLHSQHANTYTIGMGRHRNQDRKKTKTEKVFNFSDSLLCSFTEVSEDGFFG